MFNGLRIRLTMLYLLVTLTFIGLLSVGIYQLLAQYFQQTTDLGLQHKMAHEFRLLGASVPAELAAADRDWFANRAILLPPDGQPLNAQDAEQAVYGDATTQHASVRVEDYTEDFYDGELSAIFVLPLDAQGRLLFDPNPYLPPLAPHPEAVESAISHGNDWRTIRVDDQLRVRLLTYRLTRDDGPTVLQLGRIMADQDRILNQLVVILAGVGSVSTVVLGGGSWWLAGRSLKTAQQAWERQKTFVAHASHELRTPLALIRASAEAAQRRLTSDEHKQQRLLHDIIEESDHMTRLVNDLLLLSRLDMGRLKLEQKIINLTDFLDNLQRQVGRLADERGVKLEVFPAQEVVYGDPTRLHQIMLILLDNALRYTPTGGEIHIATHLQGRYVQISVADTGRGIAADQLPHVFERFYRSDAARADGSNGAGLGLTIAKSLIEAQGGQISIESQINQGTCVTLRLQAV